MTRTPTRAAETYVMTCSILRAACDTFHERCSKALWWSRSLWWSPCLCWSRWSPRLCRCSPFLKRGWIRLALLCVSVTFKYQMAFSPSSRARKLSDKLFCIYCTVSIYIVKLSLNLLKSEFQHDAIILRKKLYVDDIEEKKKLYRQHWYFVITTARAFIINI